MSRDPREPADRPILFSAPMVRALLAGRKTQTRRVIQVCTDQQAREGDVLVSWPADQFIRQGARFRLRYALGDRLWVREAWQAWTEFDGTKADDLPTHMRERINYPADGNTWDARLRRSIHMPRWASRLTLYVTDVRVQRLQDTSEEDAVAEGVEAIKPGADFVRSARFEFALLWNSLHGVDAWNANPWIVALTFAVHYGNIDALPNPIRLGEGESAHDHR